MTYINTTLPVSTLTMRATLRHWATALHSLWVQQPTRPNLPTHSPRQLRDIGLTTQDAVQMDHQTYVANASIDFAQRIRLQSTNW